MTYQLEVRERLPLRDGARGWGVTLQYCPGADELWETFDHHAVFSSRERAEGLLKRIVEEIRKAPPYSPLAALKIQEEWIWAKTQCSCLGFMRNAPTAKLKRID